MPRDKSSKRLDEPAWRLLSALQEDGRSPLKSLAESAGLSVAATAERLKRLQRDGYVRAISAEVDHRLAGYAVKAIVGITANQPGKKGLLDKLRRAPEVIECHHVAGADSYMMIVVAADLEALESFISSINSYGETRTSIVFSTPIQRRGVVQPGAPGRR